MRSGYNRPMTGLSLPPIGSQKVQLPPILYYSGGEQGLARCVWSVPNNQLRISTSYKTTSRRETCDYGASVFFKPPGVVGAFIWAMSAFTQPLHVNTQAAGNLGDLALQPWRPAEARPYLCTMYHGDVDRSAMQLASVRGIRGCWLARLIAWFNQGIYLQGAFDAHLLSVRGRSQSPRPFRCACPASFAFPCCLASQHNLVSTE